VYAKPQFSSLPKYAAVIDKNEKKIFESKFKLFLYMLAT